MKTILIAFSTNFLIAVSKFAGFLLTRSASMLSESMHSLADCANQVLLLIGHFRSSKKGDNKFNFGHGKEEFLWSFLVAIILFTLGSVFSIYEGIKHIIHPEKLEHLPVVLVILLVGIGLESYSLFHAVKEANEEKPKKQTFIKYIKKTSNASNIVVLIEDSAAITGLLGSFIFILLAYFVDPIFDGIGAIFTGLILGFLSVFLAIELGNLIKGESLSAKDTYLIKTLILKEKLVENINGIYSTIIGNDKYLIIVSVDPFNSDSGYDIEDISIKIKNLVKEKYPESTVFVDFSKYETIKI